MEKLSLPKISCPIHPKETVTRVSLDSKNEKDLFCIECLIEYHDDLGMINSFKRVEDLIDELNKFYARSLSNKDAAKLLGDKDPLKVYQGILDEKSHNLNKLSKNIEEQKKAVGEIFDKFTKDICDYISTMRGFYFSLLDKQVVNLKNAYSSLESRIAKCHPDSTVEFSPDSLLTKFRSISSSQDLSEFIKLIRNDFPRISELNSSESTKSEPEVLAPEWLESFRVLSSKNPQIVQKNSFHSDFQFIIEEIHDHLNNGIVLEDEIGKLAINKKKETAGCGRCGGSLEWCSGVHLEYYACNRCDKTRNDEVYYCDHCDFVLCVTCYDRDYNRKKANCSECSEDLEEIKLYTDKQIVCKLSCKSSKMCSKYFTCPIHDGVVMYDSCERNTYGFMLYE